MDSGYRMKRLLALQKRLGMYLQHALAACLSHRVVASWFAPNVSGCIMTGVILNK